MSKARTGGPGEVQGRCVGLSPIVKPLLFIVTASAREMSRRVVHAYIESNKAAGKSPVVDELTEKLDTMVVFEFVN